MPHIRANDPACVEWNRMLMDEFARKGFYHSIPLPDGRVLEGILPLSVLQERVAEFPIPADLSGKRVLDIGTWDGFFAFEMERRGADVVAIDNTEVENFAMAREMLGSKAEYRVQDVYDLSLEGNGRFDVVFFMGVLYHLKHPLLGLERVCEVTADMAIVESFVTNESATGAIPSLEFYETVELLGQVDNWCGPNIECLLAMCRTAGFARAVLLRVGRQRALVACYRHWEPEPEHPTAEPPRLMAVTHCGNYGGNVSRRRDDYLTAFFKSDESAFTLEEVFPEISGFGVRPVSINHIGGDGWQASFRLPPGLDAGWHEARIRTAHSRYSNTCRIAVDLPVEVEHLKIAGACDAVSWRPGEVTAGDEAFLSIWVEGLPGNADRGNIRVTLGGKRLNVHGVLAGGQVNAKLPAGFPEGRYDLVVRLENVASEPVPVRVVV